MVMCFGTSTAQNMTTTNSLDGVSYQGFLARLLLYISKWWEIMIQNWILATGQ